MKKPSEIFEGENSSLKKTFDEVFEPVYLNSNKLLKEVNKLREDNLISKADFAYDEVLDVIEKMIIKDLEE